MNTANIAVNMNFNPIKILHRLKNAGFTQEQAEIQVEILTEIVEEELAKKKDIAQLESRLKSEMEKIKAELELKLTIRMAAIVISTVGFFYSLEKFF